MILVTGAAGKTGRAVVGAVAASGHSVRGLVRRNEQVGLIQELGAEALVGDMRFRAKVERALEGVTAVYHIAPNMHGEEFEIGCGVIDAACEAGVGHFVFHSVLHPQTREMPHHWEKLRVEEFLLTSGLPFTILQPSAYMQNVLGYWEQIADEGVYRVPYSVDASSNVVDLGDVAEAAARVLTTPGHLGATYELSGPEALSTRNIASILSRQLGRSVRAEQISIEEWARGAIESGLDEAQVEVLSRMFHYYDRYGLAGNPNVLAWLLGRDPGRFENFASALAPDSLRRR